MRKVELGEFIFRQGRVRDASTVRRWTSVETTVAGALKGAIEHLENEDGASFVVIAPTQVPVGLLTLEVPHLQFAFFVETVRGTGIAMSAACHLIDHYFSAERSESWLGDSGVLTSHGRAFVERLGFEGGRLWRQKWSAIAPRLHRESRDRLAARPR